MKKLFTIVALVAALAFVGCNKDAKSLRDTTWVCSSDLSDYAAYKKIPTFTFGDSTFSYIHNQTYDVTASGIYDASNYPTVTITITGGNFYVGDTFTLNISNNQFTWLWFTYKKQ